MVRNLGPISGPFFRPEIDFLVTLFAQAMATWRWNSFLRSQCPTYKRCVYVNMDETCIRMCPAYRVFGWVDHMAS